MRRRQYLSAVPCVGLMIGGCINHSEPGNEFTGELASAIIHASNDHWLLLTKNAVPRHGQGFGYPGGGFLHHLSANLKEITQTEEFPPASSDIEGVVPTDVHSLPSGSRWLLDHSGGVHRLDSSWGYDGHSKPIPNPYFDRNITYGAGITRIESGGWWVSGGRAIFRVTSDWRVPEKSINSLDYHTRPSLGFPRATAYDSSTDLIILEEVGISKLPLVKDGSKVSPESVKITQGDNGPSRLGITPMYKRLPRLSNPVDITTLGDHWIVVERDGGIHEYTKNWTHIDQWTIDFPQTE